MEAPSASQADEATQGVDSAQAVSVKDSATSGSSKLEGVPGGDLGALAPAGARGTPAKARRAEEGAGKELQRSWSELASHAQRGTVGIVAGERYGAGILVTRSGLVLTNLHVVQGMDKISALLLNDETAEAALVEQAPDVDLALLQLSRPIPEAAELRSAASVQVGDEVLAVGSPRKMFFSVSRGMVSFLKRKLESVEYIQTDLPINAGNSGGPLVDRDGYVIGVVSFVLRESQGISFALPIDYALDRFRARLGTPEPTAVAEPSPLAVRN